MQRKSASSYDDAVTLLIDLRDAAAQFNEREFWRSRSGGDEREEASDQQRRCVIAGISPCGQDHCHAP